MIRYNKIGLIIEILQGTKLQPINLSRVVKLLTDPHSVSMIYLMLTSVYYSVLACDQFSSCTNFLPVHCDVVFRILIYVLIK